MNAVRFAGLGKTQMGRSAQINRGYKGMADEMKRKKQAVDVDCDEPQTLPDALRLIAHLRNQLADAQAIIEDMRTQANGDHNAESDQKVGYWDSKRVAKESNVAVCTICRNAAEMGGIKLGGDWLFPAGTTYGRRRKTK